MCVDAFNFVVSTYTHEVDPADYDQHKLLAVPWSNIRPTEVLDRAITVVFLLDLAMFLVSCGLRYLITWNGVVDMISVVSGFYRLGTLSHASTQWARSLK